MGKRTRHQVLAYFTLEGNKEISGKGPVGKFFSQESLKKIMEICKAELGDSLFLACGKLNEVEKILQTQETRLLKI